MPVVDYAAIWTFIKAIFNAIASVLSSMGLGEYGGRVVAVLLLAALFYLSGVFKKTRRVVGPLLALALLIVVLMALV
ncbi:MAG: hypothetical protein QW434_05255 [Pyrobaculum sp.]